MDKTRYLTEDCIEWDGAANTDGSGVRRHNGRNHLVHRLAWEEEHGPIQPGMFVLQRCQNKPCFNVDHLFLSRTRGVASEAGYRKPELNGRALRLERMLSGCIEWRSSRGEKPTEYGQTYIHQKKVKPHQLFFRIFHGEIPPGMVVRHSCDNPPCVNPEHLILGTSTDNVRDMDNRNRRAVLRGRNNGMTKLREDQVLEIRKLKSEGLADRVIADRIGCISRRQVNAIVTGKVWRHLA